MAARATSKNPVSVAYSKIESKKERVMRPTATVQVPRLGKKPSELPPDTPPSEDAARMVGAVTTGGAMGREDSNDASDKYIVEAFEKLAARLEGDAQKHPKSGSGLFANLTSRYFAAQPADDSQDAGKSEDKWERKLQQWRRGRLAWWKDKASFLKKDNPKGSLTLMNVSKVTWDDDHPQNVTIRHMEEKERFELVIKFPAVDIAKEFRDALFQIRSLVRRTTLVV